MLLLNFLKEVFLRRCLTWKLAQLHANCCNNYDFIPIRSEEEGNSPYIFSAVNSKDLAITWKVENAKVSPYSAWGSCITSCPRKDPSAPNFNKEMVGGKRSVTVWLCTMQFRSSGANLWYVTFLSHLLDFTAKKIITVFEERKDQIKLLHQLCQCRK